jgi:predicted ArsR family transcriptional regulator
VPEPIDPRTHRVLAGASRVRVLEFLRARDTPLTAPDVAAQVGLHPNTVRMHLDQLADAGLVTREREPRRGPGRPRLLFAAVPAAAAPPVTDDGPGAHEDGYRVLAGILAGRLERESGADAAREAAAAGRDWARTLEPVADLPSPATPAQARQRVVQVLDGMGFAPADTGPGGPIELHRCPFHQVAEEHSLVVCGVHLGLMQGVLDDVAAPVGAARLEPFVAPGLCLAHLEPPLPDVPRPTGLGSPRTEGSPS